MSEPDVSQLLSVAEAISIIDAVKVSPRVVEVALAEADGLVLAEAIKGDRDYPPFDKSQMDGFAVCAEDVKSAPVSLRVVGEIAAGASAARGLARGEAMAIMTGAPMPEGADAVVPVEETERAGDFVKIMRGVSAGKFFAKRGSEVRAGDVVLDAGTTMGPMALAVAGSVGASRVKGIAKPQAAVLSTGDELVAIDQTPGAAQIRNSNSLMLAALLRRLGCDVTDLGVVRDEPAAVRSALERAMQFDLVFVTGGMSMGTYDFVPQTLLDLGVDLRITKLRIKPGKPFVFGVKDSKFVFGLPGNPVSAFVCTVRFASRLIARLSGKRIDERWLEGVLEESLPANGPREFYQPVRWVDGQIRQLPWKGSADVFTLAKANALLVRGENEGAHAAGTRVRVLEIPGS